LIAPLSIQILHVLENHEHTVCTSKVDNHIHEKDFDCKIDLIKQNRFFLATNNFPLDLNTKITSTTSSLEYNFLKNHYQLPFSLRGPPVKYLN
jgi:hypothetical protein